MKPSLRFGISSLVGLSATFAVVRGEAQTLGDAPAGDGAGAQGAAASATVPAGGSATVNITQAAPTQSTSTTYGAIGLPPPGTQLEGHLPSSSRAVTDTSKSADGFDLLPAQSGGAVVRGSADSMGAFVSPSHSSNVPALHQVKRGDTLWDLCNGYFQNPWLWPKVWSYNPQIQNPHWIYPGDQVRLRTDVPATQTAAITLGANGVRGAQAARGGSLRRQMVPKETVFLRATGYIDDPNKDVWGELVGAEEEQMMLTEGNTAYVMLRPGADVKPGQLLTIFRSVRTPSRVAGARRPPGEIVAFKGTLRVDTWNAETRIARGSVIESLDTVERGDKIGPVGRRFEVVPPKTNDVEVEARVLTSMYPHEVIGQNQIAFIDRGSRDGLKAGNRLFVVDRGDAWRHTLTTTTRTARMRVRTDVPEHVSTEITPLNGKDEDFPEAVVGELRVLRADEYSSVTLVTSAKHEIEPGDRVVARQGY